MESNNYPLEIKKLIWELEELERENYTMDFRKYFKGYIIQRSIQIGNFQKKFCIVRPPDSNLAVPPIIEGKAPNPDSYFFMDYSIPNRKPDMIFPSEVIISRNDVRPRIVGTKLWSSLFGIGQLIKQLNTFEDLRNSNFPVGLKIEQFETQASFDCYKADEKIMLAQAEKLMKTDFSLYGCYYCKFKFPKIIPDFAIRHWKD